jgi:two-component system, cell cycle sensor histidine kinase and response regulator CckA
VFASLFHKTTSRRSVVLIVDDEHEVRELEQSMLRHAGYEVLTADGGPAALALLAEGQVVDIVVADLMMPGMDGTELIRYIRAERPELKVLFVTGYSDHLFKEQPCLWDDVAFLDKPFTMNGLIEAVATLLSGHVMQTAAETTAITPRWFAPTPLTFW